MFLIAGAFSGIQDYGFMCWSGVFVLDQNSITSSYRNLKLLSHIILHEDELSKGTTAFHCHWVLMAQVFVLFCFFVLIILKLSKQVINAHHKKFCLF